MLCCVSIPCAHACSVCNTVLHKYKASVPNHSDAMQGDAGGVCQTLYCLMIALRLGAQQTTCHLPVNLVQLLLQHRPPLDANPLSQAYFSRKRLTSDKWPALIMSAMLRV